MRNIFSHSSSAKKVFNAKKIYFDYASTTPVLPEVFLAMKPFLTDMSYNPSSIYENGVQARILVEKARKDISEEIGGRPEGLVFTASGTESNNMAILGQRNIDGRFDGVHMITSAIEHPSVIEVFKEVEKLGGEVTFVSVDKFGIINLKELSSALCEKTKMVSVMMVNNEIGTIQPIKEISTIIRKAQKKFGTKIIFHTDASQAFNYLKIDSLRLGVDMVTLDASKIYGPKGIGILYITPGIKVLPIIFGGGQERGLRSGTESLHQIIGLAKAFEIIAKKRKVETDRIMALREYCIDEILKKIPLAKLNGHREMRIANNINICFPQMDSENAVILLDHNGIECAYASSCKSTGNDVSSYVVDALGGDCGTHSLRFTLGIFTKKSQIDFLVSILQKIVN